MVQSSILAPYVSGPKYCQYKINFICARNRISKIMCAGITTRCSFILVGLYLMFLYLKPICNRLTVFITPTLRLPRGQRFTNILTDLTYPNATNIVFFSMKMYKITLLSD